MADEKAKKFGPYTHIGYSGPPDIRNFLSDCHNLACNGPRAYFRGCYPDGTPSPTSLSSVAIDLFAACFELIRDGIAPHFKPQGSTPADQITEKLFSAGIAGDVATVDRILRPLASDPELSIAVRSAMDTAIAKARRMATYAAAGVEPAMPRPDDALARPLDMPNDSPAIDATTTMVDADLKSVIAAVAGDNAVAILNVAGDSTKTADQKMRAIYTIDNRVLG
jgi:hypothetical protein